VSVRSDPKRPEATRIWTSLFFLPPCFISWFDESIRADSDAGNRTMPHLIVAEISGKNRFFDQNFIALSIMNVARSFLDINWIGFFYFTPEMMMNKISASENFISLRVIDLLAIKVRNRKFFYRLSAITSDRRGSPQILLLF